LATKKPLTDTQQRIAHFLIRLGFEIGLYFIITILIKCYRLPKGQ